MNDQQRDFYRDITEIRSMMERSSKFLSLSGWAGIMAGIYALIGAWIAITVYEFNPDEIYYTHHSLFEVLMIALFVLFTALITAIFFSYSKAKREERSVWNPTSRRMVRGMAVPLVTAAVLIIYLAMEGLLGIVAPMMLLFYGMSLFIAGYYTIQEVRLLGMAQIILGLTNLWFIESGLLFWSIGFGVMHILYGVYMHFRYER